MKLRKLFGNNLPKTLCLDFKNSFCVYVVSKVFQMKLSQGSATKEDFDHENLYDADMNVVRFINLIIF